MSTTYKTIPGDTFVIISRKKYGTEQHSGLITKANPGVLEPIESGIDIMIPDLIGSPKDIQHQTDAVNLDETAILIEGNRFRYWTDVRLIKVIDSFDTIEFSAPFDVNIPNFKNTFRPLSFKPVVMTIGGKPTFTGVIVNVNPVIERESKTITINGYSSPGVLNDCTPTSSSFPLEFDNQDLTQISSTLCAPFGINTVFKNNQGAVFDKGVSLAIGQKIWSFFIKLAKQRGLIASNDDLGQLVFKKPIVNGVPVAKLTQGESPLITVVPNFNPQEYYTSITGIEPASVGVKGSSYTINTSIRLKNVFRPLTFTVTDTNGGDIKEAVDSKAGRMLGGVISYNVDINTWRDSFDNLWETNTIISLKASDAMIYDYYNFLIHSVELNGDRSSKTATLTIVIPEAFSGKIPDSLPWD